MGQRGRIYNFYNQINNDNNNWQRINFLYNPANLQ
jgi:hypothetical protein